MAKTLIEKMNGTAKFIFWLISIIFVGGVLWANITSQVRINKCQLEKNLPRIESNEKQILVIQNDLKYIIKGQNSLVEQNKEILKELKRP